jgi:hypothetical protein
VSTATGYLPIAKTSNIREGKGAALGYLEITKGHILLRFERSLNFGSNGMSSTAYKILLVACG